MAARLPKPQPNDICDCCDKEILQQEGSMDPVEFVCEQFTKKGFISYFIPKKLYPGLVGIVLL